MRLNVIRSAWKVAAAAVVVTAAFCGQAKALNDILTQWTFEAGPAGNPPAATGTDITGIDPNTGSGTALGHHTSAATVWDNPSGNGSPESMSSNNWTAGDYYQFKTSTTGVSNIGFEFDQVSSTTGPRDFTLQYSTDGTTFTNFANYTVQPNATGLSWGATEVQPIGLDTQVFDLRGITALNNAADIYLRLTAASPIVAAQPGSTPAPAGTDRLDWVTVYNNFDPTQAPVQQPLAPPVAPQAGDIVMGLSNGRPRATLDLVRGTVVANGGAEPAPLAPWQNSSTAGPSNFIQMPRFDNLGGVMHNVAGNLIGVDAGTSTLGGKIYSFATQGAVPFPAGQLIGNSTGTGGAGLTLTRFGGPSISPNNTKIAVAGFDTGKVIVYDYTAGNTMGSGASLTGARETAGTPLSTSFTQGTAWLNNNTVLAFNVTGELQEVDATTMANVLKTTLPGLGADTSKYTSLAYNASISPYIYAMYGGFTSPTSNNQLFILDTAYNLVKQVNLSTSMDTAREIALDKNGNLFISQSAQKIDYLLDVVTPAGIAALTDNSSVDWYTSTTFTNFPGLDIGFAAPGIVGDYNSDGKVDAGDYVTWRKAEGTTNVLANDPVGGTIGTAQYNNWRANFGNPPGAGSGDGLGGASVPEPASAVLLVIGLAAFCSRRRSA